MFADVDDVQAVKTNSTWHIDIPLMQSAYAQTSSCMDRQGMTHMVQSNQAAILFHPVTFVGLLAWCNLLFGEDTACRPLCCKLWASSTDMMEEIGRLSYDTLDMLSAVMGSDTPILDTPVAIESSFWAVSMELPDALQAIAGGSHIVSLLLDDCFRLESSLSGHTASDDSFVGVVGAVGLTCLCTGGVPTQQSWSQIKHKPSTTHQCVR